MGTNFYMLERGKEGAHIGKRSAAGAWCYDCDVTLCMGGNREIHMGKSGWFDHCPDCNHPKKTETITTSAAGVELGFNKTPTKRKKGVASTSSFSWAMAPHIFTRKTRNRIVDEYGQKYTFKQFAEILKACRVQYYESIGKEFC